MEKNYQELQPLENFFLYHSHQILKFFMRSNQTIIHVFFLCFTILCIGGIPRGPSPRPVETEDLSEGASRRQAAKAEESTWRKPWLGVCKLCQGWTLSGGCIAEDRRAKALPRRARVQVSGLNTRRPNGPSSLPKVSPRIGPSYLAR